MVKISNELKKLLSTCEQSIIRYFKNNFKYPEGFKVVFYKNSKYGDNVIKKILVHQLNISLSSLRDFGGIVNELIEKNNSISNLDGNAFDSFISLKSDFQEKLY